MINFIRLKQQLLKRINHGWITAYTFVRTTGRYSKILNFKRQYKNILRLSRQKSKDLSVALLLFLLLHVCMVL